MEWIDPTLENLASIARNVEVEIYNADKQVTYKRLVDTNQWYCRVLNFVVNNNVRGGWRISSLTLGLGDAELVEEEDNFVDVILFLDYFDKPDKSHFLELSVFADGAQAWRKTVRFLPTNEVLFSFPEDGFFNTHNPFQFYSNNISDDCPFKNLERFPQLYQSLCGIWARWRG